MRQHRGMLGKVSSKQTAAKCAPPALYKATDELRGKKRSIYIYIYMLVCVFPFFVCFFFYILCVLVYVLHHKGAAKPEVHVPLSNFVTLRSIMKLRMAVKIPRAA